MLYDDENFHNIYKLCMAIFIHGQIDILPWYKHKNDNAKN